MSAIVRKIKPYYENFLQPLINFAVKKRINPDYITLLGLILVGTGSYFLYTGNKILALIFLTVGALSDSVDGAIARKLGRKSKFGAFLDSTTDRFSDAFPFVSLGLYYSEIGDFSGVLLSFLALITSFGVSYTRARAESLGVNKLGGIFERTERWVILVIGILSGYIKEALLIIFLGSLITVLQRVYETKKFLEESDEHF